MFKSSKSLTCTAAAALVSCISSFSASADVGSLTYGDRIGSVGSFTNDIVDGGHDRWQTGSYQRSFFYGDLDGSLESALEYRLRGQLVSPWYNTAAFDDRHYGAALGAGVFHHSGFGNLDTRIGGELLMIGDQTGLDTLQYTFHDLLGFDKAYDVRTRNDPHIADDFSAKLEGEVALNFDLGKNTLLRPYATAEVGAETSVRAGADVVFGPMTRGDSKFWTRDVVTGQPLTINSSPGLSFVAGFDVGHVESSYFFPDTSEAAIKHDRFRGRIGVQTTIGALNVFYGHTWLSEEFVGQPEIQSLGSVSISLAF
jgi:hypothetical protein